MKCHTFQVHVVGRNVDNLDGGWCVVCLCVSVVCVFVCVSVVCVCVWCVCVCVVWCVCVCGVVWFLLC